MTIATEQLMPSFWMGLQSGTVSVFSSIFTQHSHARQSPPPLAPRPAYLHVSPGVSDSARLVKSSVDDLAGDIDRWLTTFHSAVYEIEQDVVVLLPPKRQYVANFEIIARQRPGLLIDPEDFPDSQMDADLTE